MDILMGVQCAVTAVTTTPLTTGLREGVCFVFPIFVRLELVTNGGIYPSIKRTEDMDSAVTGEGSSSRGVSPESCRLGTERLIGYQTW